MTEAFHHLTKVKCRESQCPPTPTRFHTGIGGGSGRHSRTIGSSWRKLGPEETAWILGTLPSLELLAP